MSLAGPFVPATDGPVRCPQIIRDNMPVREGVPEMVEEVSKPIAIALLIAKLHSETEEIARDLKNPEEYADLLEAVYALMDVMNVRHIDVERASTVKHHRKGGFAHRQFWAPTALTEVNNGR